MQLQFDRMAALILTTLLTTTYSSRGHTTMVRIWSCWSSLRSENVTLTIDRNPEKPSIGVLHLLLNNQQNTYQVESPNKSTWNMEILKQKDSILEFGRQGKKSFLVFKRELNNNIPAAEDDTLHDAYCSEKSNELESLLSLSEKLLMNRLLAHYEYLRLFSVGQMHEMTCQFHEYDGGLALRTNLDRVIGQSITADCKNKVLSKKVLEKLEKSISNSVHFTIGMKKFLSEIIKGVSTSLK